MASLENGATEDSTERERKQRRRQKKQAEARTRADCLDDAIKYAEGHTLVDGANSVVIIASIFYAYVKKGIVPKRPKGLSTSK